MLTEPTTLSSGRTSGDRVPDFVIAGAAKAGTTALHLALSAHPEIYMPESKEPDFFAQMPEAFGGPGDQVMRGRIVRDERAYCQLYKSRRTSQICGEASVSYLYFHDSAARIAAWNPDAKIIIVLRNPVDRAYSQYMFNRRDLREPLSFGAALDSEDVRASSGWAWAWQYRKVGLYSAGVSAYLEAFAREQVFIGLYEDLKASPAAFMRSITNFLLVNGEFALRLGERNVSGESRIKLIQRALLADSAAKRMAKAILPWRLRARIREGIRGLNTRRVPMRSADRQRLVAYYADEIRRLEAILDRNLDAWKK